MSMADKIAVMYGRFLQQVGSPSDVYDRPANLFVAGFIGSPSMNFAPCRLDERRELLIFDGGTVMALQAAAKQRFEDAPVGKSLILGVRPEDISLRHDAADGISRWRYT